MSLQSTLVLIGTLIINFTLAFFWMQWKKIHPFIIRFEKYTPLLIIVTLLATWAFIFLIYKFPISGDVVNFFIPQGKQAFSGSIPNRDFASSYMPLFPYIIGSIYFVWQDSRSLGLFFTICICIFFTLFFYFLRKKKIYASDNSMLLTVGLLNSTVLILGIGYQQDECYILLLIGFLLIASVNKWDLFTGIIAGFTLVLTKSTIIILLIPFLLLCEKKRDFLIGVSAITIPVLGLFLMLGFSPVMMLMGESTAIVPPSLITNFRAIPPIYLFFTSKPLITYFLNISVLGIVGIFVIQKHINYSFRNLLSLLIVIWLLFLIMSLKSLTSYRLLVIPFIPFVLDIYRQRWKSIPIYFSIYCSLVSIHTMFYEDWNKITRTNPYFSMIPNDHLPQYIILTSIEFLIVYFEIVWIFFALKSITKNSDEQDVSNSMASMTESATT